MHPSRAATPSGTSWKQSESCRRPPRPLAGVLNSFIQSERTRYLGLGVGIEMERDSVKNCLCHSTILEHLASGSQPLDSKPISRLAAAAAEGVWQPIFSLGAFRLQRNGSVELDSDPRTSPGEPVVIMALEAASRSVCLADCGEIDAPARWAYRRRRLIDPQARSGSMEGCRRQTFPLYSSAPALVYFAPISRARGSNRLGELLIARPPVEWQFIRCAIS